MTPVQEAISRLTAWVRDFGENKPKTFVDDVSTILEFAKTVTQEQKLPKGKIAAECNLDVDPGERARALHRVVRAMHDGHCPKCGCLESADVFMQSINHTCPECGFAISIRQAELALAEFRPYLQKSVEIFEQWRDSLPED